MATPDKVNEYNYTSTPPEDKLVAFFHKNADVDDKATSMHHTLGPGAWQSSPGNHVHDGGQSALILKGVPVNDLATCIAALKLLGAV